MRKLIITLLAFLPLAGMAQVTTETEYNYMKKGYRQVAESGLDVKKGYTVEILKGGIKTTYYTMEFTLLKRNDSSMAGIIVKTFRTGYETSTVKYYAIPAPNRKNNQLSFGWDEFEKDIDNMSGDEAKALLNWTSYRLSYEMYMRMK